MTTVLRGITWEHDRGHGSMVAAAIEYRRVRPDVEVTWHQRSLQVFAEQPVDDLVDDYDLLVIDHPHVASAAHRGLLAPLDGRGHDGDIDVLAAQSIGRSHESYHYAGRQWGLATDAAAQVSVYRPDLLPDPPTNWAAVLDLARGGRVLWPAKPIDAYSSLITVAAGNGTPPMSSGGAFLPEHDAVEAMALLRALASAVPADNLQMNPIQVLDAMSESDRWVYSPLVFGYTNYSRAGFRANRLAFTDIPLGSAGVRGSLLGGAGIVVSPRSTKTDEAIAHAFWLASAETQAGAYYDGGGQPGNSVAWADARINADSLDFFTSTRATIDHAYLRPKHPRYVSFQDAASPLVTAALAGDIDDRALASRMNELYGELGEGD